MGNLQVVKKAGGYDEKGECIIPMEYDEIKKLKSGVYQAMILNPPFKDIFHLYTDKGILEYQYEGNITEVLCDKNEEIIALQIFDGINCEWHLVEIDYENNVINKLYKNSIDEVDLFLSNNCIRLHTLHGFTEIFSRELKKLIVSLATELKIHFVGKEGFILEDKDKQKAFVNLEGVRVLDFSWDHICLVNGFITVIKEIGNGEYNFGLYTYEGGEVLPCAYWGREYVVGIEPEICCIDGIKVWLFKTRRKEDDIYYEELIKADGEAVLSISGDDVFMSDVSLRVHEGSNVIIRQKGKATLYKLEMNKDSQIKAVVVCEADKIRKLYEYGQYRVHKGWRKGTCNKNGIMIQPLRFKKISEIVNDYFCIKN